nr:hypothetical protein [Candidatus Sigynarchaeota archaeon]
FPGTARAGEVESALVQLFVNNRFHVVSDARCNRNAISTAGPVSRMFDWLVNIGLVCLGIVMDVLVISGFHVVPMNHVIAWSIACYGFIMLCVLCNESGNSRPSHSYAPTDNVGKMDVANGHVLVLPLVIAMNGIAFAAYLLGNMAGSALLGSKVPVASIIVYVLLVTVLSWWVLHETFPRGDVNHFTSSSRRYTKRITVFLFSIHQGSCKLMIRDFFFLKVLLGIAVVGGCFIAGLLFP